MSADLLARALGRCLAQLDNLNVAHIPVGLDASFSEELARHACLLRPEDPDFAILVREHPGQAGTAEAVEVTPGDATRYREGNRLAVFVGRPPELASLTGTFRMIMDASYPDRARGYVALDTLASACVVETLAAGGASVRESWSRDEAAKRLCHVLEALRSAYESLGSGSYPWNTMWMRHVATGLHLLADEIARADPATDLDHLFSEATFASFSLPTPEDGVRLRRFSGSIGNSIARAVRDWWCDSDTISSTVALLARHPDIDGYEEHPLVELDWTSFDRELALADNPLLAFARTEAAAAGRTSKFAALTEREFFAPVAGDEMSFLRITDEAGRNLADDRIAGELHLIPARRDPGNAASASIASSEIRVVIPTLGMLSSEMVEESRLRVIVSSRTTSFEGRLRLDSGELVAVGRLLENRTSGKLNSPPRKARVTVALDALDPLHGHVVPSASASCVLIPADVDGIALFTLSDSGRLGALEAVESPSAGSQATSLDAPASVRHVLEAASRKRVVAWASSAHGSLALNGDAVGGIPDREQMWAFDLLPSGTDFIRVGQLEVEIVVESHEDRPFSPVVAAVRKCAASDEEPSASLSASLRGELEVEIARTIRDDRWRRSLGHLFLPVDLRTNIVDLVEVPEDPFLTAPEVERVWAGLGNLAVPDALVNSDEAERFRACFEDLEISARLMNSDGTEAGDTYLWPSQASWAHLWDERRTSLDAYLESYAELVSRARSLGEPNGVLWASYPFSATLWRVDSPPARCRGALLSPLHPLRLAWLAAVEWTLRHADSAGALAGTVEGWNFPQIGPSDSRNGRLMAVPIDNGEGQLFLGWSMLVPASTTGPEMLAGPEYVGNRPAPGSSSSGLNSGAVSSALRDYRRMNPHVSTLTLDLAANVAAPRLEEIDRAVVGELRKWASNQDGDLPGGARIFDSLNRRGDVPRGELSDLVSVRSKVPITWSRYSASVGNRPVANLRVLQDAGIALEVEEGGPEAAFGVVASTPLRRFEAHDPSVGSSGAAVSNPVVAAGMGWPPFVAALRQMEVPGGEPQGVALKSQLVGGVLASEDADWTVSGEVMVNPVALSSMLGQRGSAPRMLWEWRPPFFVSGTGSDAEPQLEHRPYVSVVRVPRNLQNEIKAKLERCLEAPVTDDHVQDVLRTLGSRGIGLSSLTSMGGTHATGALGFFSTLKLIDACSFADSLFVLPIDACDQFLGALASDHESLGDRRRADLLLIRLTEDDLRFVPIEIKFYGLETPHGVLPRPSSPSLSDPLDQLAGTCRLLERVASNMKVGEDSATQSLARNALTSLVEAAVRLSPRSPGNREALARSMTALATGSMSVSVGRPILTYVLNGATTPDGSTLDVALGALDERQGGCGLHAEFLVNAGALVDEALGAPGELSQRWGELVTWAFAKAAASSPIGMARHRASEADSGSSASGESEPTLEATPEGIERTPSVGSTVEIDDASGAHTTPHATDPSHREVNQPQSQTEGSDLEVPQVGVRFNVGYLLNSVRRGEADFWPSNTNLNQLNVGVVGDLGTGKTQLLKALVLQLRRGAHQHQPRPISMLIFDYKRDFQDSAFIELVGGRVLEPLNIPLNVLALSEPYAPHVAYKKAQGFVDILSRIYSGIGPVQTDHLVTAITDLFERLGGAAPTLAEVLAEYRSAGQAADSVVSVLNIFVKGHLFSDDRETLVPFADLIRNQVLVVNLAELGADKNTKNAIVALFLNQYYEYMLELEKWPYTGTNPQLRQLNSYLLIDEAVNIMQYRFAVLESLLLQGREFGVGVMLSSQYLTHFQQTGVNYGEPLRTWLIHRVPNVGQRELQRLGLPGATQSDAERISQLSTHEVYYSSLGFAGVFVHGTPFYQIATE